MNVDAHWCCLHKKLIDNDKDLVDFIVGNYDMSC
jgi:hypothetical protein